MLLLLLIIVPIASAKCGLWRQFDHSTVRDGPHLENRWGGVSGSARADTQWAMGFGFQSLDQQLICNDMEMFYQCDAARQMISSYNIKMGLPMHIISCYENIVCNPPLPPGNGKFWCQNMDSYDLCMSVKKVIEDANETINYPVECEYAVMLSDNIQVLDYRRPATITSTTMTTVVTTTPDPNATTITTVLNTTAPASAYKMAISLSLMASVTLFICLLL